MIQLSTSLKAVLYRPNTDTTALLAMLAPLPPGSPMRMPPAPRSVSAQRITRLLTHPARNQMPYSPVCATSHASKVTACAVGHHRRLGARRGLHGLELRGPGRPTAPSMSGAIMAFDLIRTARRIGVVESNIAEVDMLHALGGGGITLDRDQCLAGRGGARKPRSRASDPAGARLARSVEDRRRGRHKTIRPAHRRPRAHSRHNRASWCARDSTASNACPACEKPLAASCRESCGVSYPSDEPPPAHSATRRSGLSGQRRQIFAAGGQPATANSVRVCSLVRSVCLTDCGMKKPAFG